MGRESTAWDTLRGRLATGGLHSERLTDRIQDGLPDVLWTHLPSRISGLLETKAIERWPTRGSTKVTFEVSQTVWLYRWRHRGGRAAVLTRIVAARLWVFNPVRDDIAWTSAIKQDILSVPHTICDDSQDISVLINLLIKST